MRGWIGLVVVMGMMGGAAMAQQPEPACSMCKEWNVPQEPFRIYGNTYYVGTHGLAAILIVGDKGDVLIDGAIRESAPQIAANIEKLGFKLGDVKVILNSHVHHDHAGGIAELQRLTGARVLASGPSAATMKAGGVDKDDPQYGDIRGLDAVANVSEFTFEKPVKVGSLALTPHLTAGHTPGGTTWTWESCEAKQCERLVYADSITAVAAPGYKFSAHPEVVAAFERSFAFLDTVPCDVLVTPHPEASNLFARVEAHAKGTKPDPLVDAGACKRLADDGRARLKARLAGEK